MELTPPHNLDAEKALIGAVLVDSSRLAQVMTVVNRDDFYREAHRIVFDVMVALADTNSVPDFITVKDALSRRGQLDEVGGPSYISGLTDGVPRTSNAVHYARIVRDMARLRSVMETGRWMAQTAALSDGTPAALISEASSRLSAITVDEHGGAVSASDAVLQYVEAVSSGTAAQPIPTGFTDLDALVQGLRPKELVIVAARPSVGKTAFMMGLADRLTQAGQPSVVFTLEVSTEKLAAQLLAFHSNVPTAEMESGISDESEYMRVGQAAHRFSAMPMHIIETANTLLEVQGWCRRLHAEHQLKFAFIDYLQLMSLGERVENRQIEIAKLSRGLKLMAKDLGITVVALSQLGRAPEARRDKRPQLSDLRESGALEQDADMAMLLFRPEMYSSKPEDAGIAEVIVAKNRNGPTGPVKLAFVKKLARFDNLAQAEAF